MLGSSISILIGVGVVDFLATEALDGLATVSGVF